MLFKSISTGDFELTVKDVDNLKGIVTGYFSAFGIKDSDGDIMQQGAFSKTISERFGKGNIAHLLQHDMREPVGKLLTLKEDSFGLYFESQLSKFGKGPDVLGKYQEKIYNQHSIGYRTIIEEWNKETDTYTLKEVKLYEGSTVTLGANDQTPVTGIKSLHDLEERISSYKSAIKSGRFTDATFIELEAEYKKLEEVYSLAKTHLAGQSTKEIDKPKADTKEIYNIFNNIFTNGSN